MNRNQLLIAIAAVVVVGIAVGLLLSGAGQPGPLSGALGQAPTSINLSVTDCWTPNGDGEFGWVVRGCLVTSSGEPVPNRAVTLYTEVCRNGGCTLGPSETVLTNAAGWFYVWKPQTPDMYEKTEEYQAWFGGDYQYGPSESNYEKRPC